MSQAFSPPRNGYFDHQNKTFSQSKFSGMKFEGSNSPQQSQFLNMKSNQYHPHTASQVDIAS